MPNWVKRMSRSPSKPTIKTQILACLQDGEKQMPEIYEAVSAKEASIRAALGKLQKDGEIENIGHGHYRLKAVQDTPAEAENSRGEAENTETINKLLNIYEVLLDNIVATLPSELAKKETIEEKVNLIKSLRWVAATIDQLMKRWYLVHRGYDSNTKQAHEDAKRKTADREKWETENAPPESQLEVVREYGEGMQEILKKMPHAVRQKTTV